jgi:very-short-patch-repair endonuclease
MRRRLIEQPAAAPLRPAQHSEPRAAKIRWSTRRVGPDPSVWRVGVLEALRVAFIASSREEAVIVLDSCLNLELVREWQLDDLRRILPSRCRSWVDLADGRCESGGETAVRLRLRDLGIPFHPQVKIPGIGRVDGVIGRRTFVEIDGYSAHGSAEAFENDHDRGLGSVLWNQHGVRLSSNQVFNDWDTCLAAIRAALERD